jgi:hypothetical protein
MTIKFILKYSKQVKAYLDKLDAAHKATSKSTLRFKRTTTPIGKNEAAEFLRDFEYNNNNPGTDKLEFPKPSQEVMILLSNMT